MVVPMPPIQTQDSALALPLNLPFLRIRLTMRLLEDAALPPYKGAMLRGG
ncbi:MAG: hypothetical protein MI924_31465 [Chloroflexales bacterium]|nr:hypothetical protein [Chloroflexales bacterium]